MRIENVIIRQGTICAVTEELPKEPKVCAYKTCDRDGSCMNHCRRAIDEREQYESALQLIKDNAVPFENQEIAAELLDASHNETYELKDDTFYPVSVEVEIINECECLNHEPKTLPCALNDKHCKATKLARIVEEPEEKPVKSEAITYTQQIEFVKAAFQYYVGYQGLDGFNKFLQESEFAITRKKDSEVEDQEDCVFKVIEVARMESMMPAERYQYIKSHFSITRIKQ